MDGIATGTPTKNVRMIKKEKEIKVEVPNLVSLGTGASYVLTGNSGKTKCGGVDVPILHSDNHYGDAKLLADLVEIVKLLEFIKSFNVFQGLRIRINDMSLKDGGLFDICSHWVTPHKGHRVGVNADISFLGATDSGGIVAFTQTEKNILHLVISLVTRDVLREEKNNHFHTKPGR